MFNRSNQTDLDLSDLDRILLSRQANGEITPCARFRNIKTISKDSGSGFVRMHNTFLAKKNGLFKRGQPVLVINRENGLSIYGYARGCSSDINLDKYTVGVDYDFYQKLELASQSAQDLEVKPASIFDTFQWQWNHADHGVRLAVRISIAAFVLEVLGLVEQTLQFFI